MTNFRFLILVFCFRGNDGILSFRNLPEKTETAPPSFPRRRESRHSILRQFIEND
ncbi:pilS cassette [Neisseria meningitidis]|nr:pilS cassette [Neisseria meningitidis]